MSSPLLLSIRTFSISEGPRRVVAARDVAVATVNALFSGSQAKNCMQGLGEADTASRIRNSINVALVSGLSCVARSSRGDTGCRLAVDATGVISRPALMTASMADH